MTRQVTLTDVQRAAERIRPYIVRTPVEQSLGLSDLCGSEVWLKLKGFEAKRSRVIWTNGKEIGCEFEAPLHQRELDQIVAPAPRRIPKGVFRRV